jgi:hypothetical protein
MVEARAPLGLLIATLGAAVLAISVFLPWYGLSITQPGATAGKRQLVSAAQQYGNTTLEKKVSGVTQRFDSLIGRQLATVSAHQALEHVSLFLLLLAGIALVASLLRLADMRRLLFATGGQVAFVGGVAAVVVIVRIVRPPGEPGQLIALTLTWGIWVSLLSAAAIVAGGLLAGSGQAHARTRPKVGPGAATAKMPSRF